MSQSWEAWKGLDETGIETAAAVTGPVAVREVFTTYSDDATGEQQVPFAD
jgi:hypothetical protein